MPDDNDATEHMTDQELMARVIWGEARSEGSKGMQGVANVMMNRLHRKSWFGRTINEVIRKPWQFSCLNCGDPNRSKLLSVTKTDKEYAECLRIAGLALAGNLPDVTNGCCHYLDSRLRDKPRWAIGLDPLVIINHHWFYKTN